MLKRQDPESGKQRLAKAISAAVPAVWDWDLAAAGFLATNRLYDIHGFPHDRDLSFADLRAATFGPDQSVFDDLAEGRASLPNAGQLRYRIRRADTGELRWIRSLVSAHPHAADPKRASSYTGIIEDITEETRANFALMESEERFRLAIEAGKMAVWEVDLETGTVTNSPALNLLFGFPKDATPSFDELRSRYAPGEVDRLAREGATLEEVRQRYAKGELRPRHEERSSGADDRTQVQAELSIIVPSGERKNLLYRAQYAYSLEGRPRITGLLVDITDRKIAEERLAVVARELQHRVKNSLAVVNTIASQSFRDTVDARSAVKSFQERLQALARATDIILGSTAQDADVAEIVHTITKPYRIVELDSFDIEGASVRVPGKVATAISMALHELCTNAVKYGALSVPDGRVSLSWSLAPDGRLTLRWIESGGPRVLPSPSRGFGTQLLDILVATDLAGSLDLRFEPEGLVCRITTGQILG